jgi:hypothetical protein
MICITDFELLINSRAKRNLNIVSKEATSKYYRESMKEY